MLPKVAIVGLLKSSLIAALPKLCLTHQWANRYSFLQDNGDHSPISLLKISIYLLPIGLPARRLPKYGVPYIPVRTGGCSGTNMHLRCRLVYHWKHHWKCEEKGRDALQEWIEVKYWRAQSQMHHLAVVQLIRILSFVDVAMGVSGVRADVALRLRGVRTVLTKIHVSVVQRTVATMLESVTTVL